MSPSPIFHPLSVLPPRTLSSFINLNSKAIQTPTQPSTPHSETPVSSTTTLPTSTHPSIISNTTTTTYPNTNPEKALNMHSRRNNRVVETRTTKPTLMTRLRGRNANTRTVKTTTKVEPATVHNTHHTHHTHHTHTHNTRRAQPVVHHKRHATMGDKFSGAMMKLRGSLTRRPGLKAAGTRRMHGTDGRGSHRTY